MEEGGMGIDPLLGMLRTMSNCLGDVAISAIVAKSENLLDMDTWEPLITTCIYVILSFQNVFKVFPDIFWDYCGLILQYWGL